MKNLRKNIVDYVVYLIVRMIICVVQALPIKACQQVAKFLAFLATDVLRIRSRLIEENLSQVFADSTPKQRKKIIREMWQHLCLMVFEIAHAPRKIHETNWRDYVEVSDKREIVTQFLAERPKIMVSGHFGNFELAGFVTGLIGFPGYTVARSLDNPFLDRYVRKFREAKGQYILNTAGSSQAIQEQLERNQLLTLLGDQHTELGAVWVDFLGRPAACHKSLAVFTLSCDAPMLITYAKRMKKYENSSDYEPLKINLGLQGMVNPDCLPEEINGVRDLTCWYNRRLEEIILSSPGHYWWVHNRWKPKPEKRKSARAKKTKTVSKTNVESSKIGEQKAA